MPKICSGCHSVPTHQIFSIDNLFFLSIFRTHQFFSANTIFFLWNLETHPHIYGKLIFPYFLTLWLKTFFCIRKSIPLYSAVWWVLQFFWVHKHVKSLKMIHFLSTFSRNDHNFSLMHHGKNVQDHGKKLQIGLFGTHQISIPSANFCLTPLDLSCNFTLQNTNTCQWRTWLERAWNRL